MRAYFLKSKRIGFSNWSEADLGLAESLWGDRRVTKFIAKPGGFSPEDVRARLSLEMDNQRAHGVSYWPIFDVDGGMFIGCCGFRPFWAEENALEIGFHLLPEFWGKGYASEAARSAIGYAFGTLHIQKLVAGHHPENGASRSLLTKLGFRSIGEHFYAPTGLNHPSYELDRADWRNPNG